MVCLVLATGIHAAVVLGVRFGVDLSPPPELADTLDIVLVKWRSESAPEDADFLAQASQQGGGNSTRKERPSRPVSGELPQPARGEDPVQSSAQAARPQPREREIIAAESPAAQPQEVTRIQQPDTGQPSAARLMRESMNIASLQPEISHRRNRESRLPRRKHISANTREYEFASYMSAWVAKVERVGNLNYPTELRQKKLHGDLVLSVGIKQDGSVDSIEVMRSSGILEIDRAAERIVVMAAPYSPLPENITDQVDILHITRTWRFEAGLSAD